MSETKKKIAVLGGGLGSMVTAIELSDPKHQGKYDITVYQMGWRLGGKGASGRNRDHQNRIEEHGLHLWFGFYDHAFELIKNCYAENARPLGKPLSTWNEAFKPCNFFVLEENINNKWEKWALPFPDNKLEPGLGGAKLSLMDYASEMARFALEYYETCQVQFEEVIPTERSTGSFLKDIAHDVTHFFNIFNERQTNNTLHNVLIDVHNAFSKNSAKSFDGKQTKWLILVLEGFLAVIGRDIDAKVQNHTQLRRIWILINLALSSILGFLRDDVFAQGLQVINKYDYKEWLRRNGASPLTYNSAPVNAIYSAFFSLDDSFAAGTAMNINLHLAMKYKGSFYYRMQAGMGDTIFGPIYEVLKKRGVKFKFFHKIDSLKMSADQSSIEAINGSIQVTLADQTKEYYPLFDVKGLPCWPSMPLYEQIDPKQATELIKNKINLESYWTPWKPIAQFTLKQGVDYDHVVLGISIAALKDICADIIENKTINGQKAWKNMMQKVGAIPTQALQLWLKADVAGMGWQFWQKELAFLSTYTNDPLNTWADMSDLIIRESWTDEHFPNNSSYFCNGYKPPLPIPPAKDHNYPAAQLLLMKLRSVNALNKNLGEILPNTIQNGKFNWDLLVDSSNQTGENRLDSQYLRVNVDPTEHYVLSLKDSDQYRLKASGSGFSNMTLTGDWIDNESEDGPMNGGFVEGTTLAGLKAAEAVAKAVS